MSIKVILSAGGTGGHIFPAVAIANEIKKRMPQAEILFVGALNRMEMQKIPEAGYRIIGLPITGLQRKFDLQNFLFPFKVLKSLFLAYKIMKDFAPDVVIGTGGYASAPTLKIAQILKIPYFIQEQNSFAGKANVWVSKGAKKIFVAYEGMEKFFPKERIVLTGNPIREFSFQDEIFLEDKGASLKEDGNFLGDKQTISKEIENNFSSEGKTKKKTLLVLGGSLGARAINGLIEKNLDFFKSLDMDIIWQCGKFYFEEYKKYQSEGVEVKEFIKDMNTAYATADFIISRSGASSVSELCVVGKPVLFIPSPNVAEDHQTQNALAISQKEAAILIKEKELDKVFKDEFLKVYASPELQQKLSQNIKKLSKPEATKEIVDIILSEIE